MLSTLNVFTRCFTLDPRRRSDVFVLAFAVKATDCVSADRVRTTGLGFALVHVQARGSLRNEPFLTEALIFDAFRIVGAVEVGFAKNIYIHL